MKRFLFIIILLLTVVSYGDQRVIDLNGGHAFYPEILGMNNQFFRYPILDPNEPASPKSLRMVCTGLSGDTYDWKNLTGDSVNASKTTLPYLQLASGENMTAVVQINWRGVGVGLGSSFAGITNTDVNDLAELAADWVTYCNKIVPYYRQGDTLPVEYQQIIDELNWGDKVKLVAPGEPLPKPVTYWLIGNEPPVCRSGYSCSNSIWSCANTLNYHDRYLAITTAMLAVDPTIKVGPCGFITHECVVEVVNDLSCQVDIVDEHPYDHIEFAWGDIADMEYELRNVKTLQVDTYNAIASLLSNSGRLEVEYTMSEWGPTGYQDLSATYSMYNALAVAETIFTHAEIGARMGQYWGQLGTTSNVPYAAYLVHSELRRHSGDTLVDSYTDGTNFRMYTTLDSGRNKVGVWALNFSNSQAKTIDLSLTNLTFAPEDAVVMTLRQVEGDSEPLMALNDPVTRDIEVKWDYEYINLTAVPMDPNGYQSDYQMMIPPASIVVLLVDPMTQHRPAYGMIYQDDFEGFHLGDSPVLDGSWYGTEWTSTDRYAVIMDDSGNKVMGVKGINDNSAEVRHVDYANNHIQEYYFDFRVRFGLNDLVYPDFMNEIRLVDSYLLQEITAIGLTGYEDQFHLGNIFLRGTDFSEPITHDEWHQIHLHLKPIVDLANPSVAQAWEASLWVDYNQKVENALITTASGTKCNAVEVRNRWQKGANETMIDDFHVATRDFAVKTKYKADSCAEVIEMGLGLSGDIDHDCQVGLSDLALMAGAWLDCNDPDEVVCNN